MAKSSVSFLSTSMAAGCCARASHVQDRTRLPGCRRRPIRGPGEVICILIIGLALFFPIFAAHLQDDKSRLQFTRFLELRRPGGRKSRKGGKAGGTFTLEEAEATAKADGLVLVRSRKNLSGYKGVSHVIANAIYIAQVWEEGKIMTIGRYATRSGAPIYEPLRWILRRTPRPQAAFAWTQIRDILCDHELPWPTRRHRLDPQRLPRHVPSY